MAVSLLVTIFPLIAGCIATLLLVTSVVPAIALVVVAHRRWRTLVAVVVAVVIAVTPHGTALTRWWRGIGRRFCTQSVSYTHLTLPTSAQVELSVGTAS